VTDVDFPRTARRILTLALVLTVAGSAYFFFAEALRGLLSFLFGAAVSIALLALLARTLLLLDVTGTEGGNTPKSTQLLLMLGQFAIFGAVYWVVNHYPVHINAVAFGFSVGIVAAMLEQGAGLLRGRQD
jgi:hypothetical protein